MLKILTIVLFSAITYQAISIYTFGVEAVNGGTINFSQYEGKRILIVNTATQSELASQFGELQQLQQTHAGNLVVIAFPSNSFGSEPLSNQELGSYLQDTYNISFPIAAKVNVTDSLGPVSPLYRWLTSKQENGVMNGKIYGNFQKYLISKQGRLVGYFDSTISPLSQPIQTALQIHQ